MTLELFIVAAIFAGVVIFSFFQSRFLLSIYMAALGVLGSLIPFSAGGRSSSAKPNTQADTGVAFPDVNPMMFADLGGHCRSDSGVGSTGGDCSGGGGGGGGGDGGGGTQRGLSEVKPLTRLHVAGAMGLVMLVVGLVGRKR